MEMEKTKTQPTNVVSSGCGHCYAETLIPAKGRKDLFALIRKDRGQQTIMKINRGLLARHLFAGVTSISAGRKKKEI
jgi:hypothetical protein